MEEKELLGGRKVNVLLASRECNTRFSDARPIKQNEAETHNIYTLSLVAHASARSGKDRFPLYKNVGDRSWCGKYADCESTWLPECWRRSNMVHKGGNTVAVAPSLKRLSTRRALGRGRVSRLVTTYCEDLSLWKARRDFLYLRCRKILREHPCENGAPSLLSPSATLPPFMRRGRDRLLPRTFANASKSSLIAESLLVPSVCRDLGTYLAECFQELGALSRSRNAGKSRIVALFR